MRDSRLAASLAAALVLTAVLAAPALAEVDVEVPASFNAKGTLDPDETERFRFHAEQGTTLTLSFAAAKGSTLVPDVRLVDGLGGTVDLPAGSVVASGGKVAWKSAAVPATDDYQVVVAGTGSGGYSLSLKAKPKTAWTGDVMVAPMGTADFLLAIPKGATVSLLAKPAAGSTAVGRLVSLDPTGSSIPLAALGKKTPTTHAATVGPLAEGGDYDLVVGNEGSGGLVSVAVKVKLPRTKPGKFDLRGSVLGRPSGGETLVGRLLDAGGGTVAVQDGSSDIYGAKVVLPAMALGAPTLVSVASTTDPPLPTDADQSAGPAVRLEPSGITFPVPVDVTLPFDFTKIPAGSSPADIRIRIVEDDGSETEVAPTSVGSNTVTVPTNGFSVCIPIIQSGPPNFGFNSLGGLKPGGDEFWFLQLAAELIPGAGNDSRNRSVSTALGQVSIHGDGTIDFNLADHAFQWSNQDSPPMSGTPIQAGLSESVSPDSGTLNWAYDATGTKIVLSGVPDNEPVFRVSRDGRYFAGFHENQTAPYADVQYGVRKNLKALTVASLDGAWTGCFLEMEGNSNGSSGAAGPRLTRASGTFTFDGAGNLAIAFTQRRTSFNENNGTHSQLSESLNIGNATYSIDGDGTILVVVPAQKQGDTGTTLRLLPGEGLDVLLAAHDPPLGEAAMGMVLVRQGSGLSRADLAGRYHGVNFAMDPQSYGVPATPLSIPDFNINVEALVGAFDGGAAADFSGDRYHAQRDSMQPDGTRTENSTEAFSVSVSVASQGKAALAADGKVIGQCTPDGQAVVLVSDTASAGNDFGLLFLFRSPPVKVP